MTQSVQEKSSIVIVGLGAKTSVGLTLPMTATSVRAHINCFSFHDYLRDRAQGDPFVLASLETLSNDLSVFERMVSLAVAAAHEALRPWKVFLKRFSLKDPELPVIISVPPFRPGFAQEAGKKLVLDIIHQLPIRVAQSLCSLFDSGHQGGLAA
ncbi:MAG: hypothetical protein SVT56_13400, partial [Chloroflexota bacterium]|nr:hypothetical protein [Chloroflexota bacterium]